jgi:hypothetical protein
MPKNTKVHKLADALRKKGHSKQSAIKIAQAKTGQSYKTGRKTRKKTRK